MSDRSLVENIALDSVDVDESTVSIEEPFQGEVPAAKRPKQVYSCLMFVQLELFRPWLIALANIYAIACLGPLSQRQQKWN